jgi:uncharacterized membrane protein
LFAGLYGLLRFGDIRFARGSGKTYVLATIVTCVTGLFIFRHGGFNEAHVLSILTLIVLAIGWQADRGAADRGGRRTIAALCFTLTVFFHFIPGFNETLVRIPVGDPFINGPRDPKLLALVGGTFVVFAIFGVFQARRLLRRGDAVGMAPAR